MVGWNDGEVCGEDGCNGLLHQPEKVENCSCHINPPCSACVSNWPVCDECGRVAEAQPSTHTAPLTPEQEALLWKPMLDEYRASMARRKIDEGKFVTDLHCNGSSGSTMVWTGGYEGPVTPEDIKNHFGDGTFGHRGPSMGGGRFRYTLITD